MSVLLSALLDWFLGEPPACAHPVAWIGRYLQATGKGLCALAPRRAFLGGMGWWVLGASAVTILATLATLGLARLPGWAQVLGSAVLLKPLFSFRMLATEVRAVEAAVQESLDQGRQRLSHIVSRDTSQLSATEVRESALESLSENLSDSVVAPLFWFALFGLPGAALYRFANTADAMWGYRNAWESAGKFAARADDVFNLIPARLTALLLLVAGGLRVGPSQLAVEARKTPSPNSGWPMAAFALSLGVRLGKPGVYVLNPQGSGPKAVHVQQGTWLAIAAGALGIAACGVLSWSLEGLLYG
jgi:adenosylcobinamide-phosphate synthase